MRRLLLLGRIDRRRPAAIAIAWLLGLSAASRGQDDKARQPPVPATAGRIAAVPTVVPTPPDLPVRGAGDGDDASAGVHRGDRGKAVADGPEATRSGPEDARLTPLGATTMRRAANSTRPSPTTPRPSGSMRGTPTLTRGGRRPGCGSIERTKAIADYSAAIAARAEESAPLPLARPVWSRQGDHAPAIADFDEAIRLDPETPARTSSRAIEWEMDTSRQGAVRLPEGDRRSIPGPPPAYEGRGRIWGKRGEYTKVVANFAELARVAPDDPVGHRELAWLLATCDEDAVRDGRRGRGEATAACN